MTDSVSSQPPVVPGKTFLVGEYAVLVGGEALGLATRPAFSRPHPTADLVLENHYHSSSAVGLFNQKHRCNFQVEILNPYKIRAAESSGQEISVGGFGQSTAEFIFAYMQKYKKFSLKTIFDDYRGLYMDPQHITQQPSGADLVTQLLGEVTYFTSVVENSKHFAWPFNDLSFCLISAVEKTGIKIKTHEHLQNLNRAQLLDLPGASQKVIQSFMAHNESEFLENLKGWMNLLMQRNLICDTSREIKNQLEKIKSVKLVKPCGALGADTLLVFSSKAYSLATQAELRSQGFTTLATEESLTKGPLAEALLATAQTAK